MITELANRTGLSPRGWMLYDGRCGFCSAGMRRISGLLRELGYATAPLQAPWVVERIGARLALDPQELMLLTPDGRIIGGVDAYLHIAGEVWWGKPVAWMGRIGWVHGLLASSYRWIADHRQRISAVCRLKPDLGGEGGAP